MTLADIISSTQANADALRVLALAQPTQKEGAPYMTECLAQQTSADRLRRIAKLPAQTKDKAK